MIDPKELRFGNYVIGDNGTLISAEQIDCHEHEINEWSNTYNTQPIPLTNAVLEAIKGKFESVGEITIVIVESNKFCIVKFGELYFISPDFEREPSVNGCRIKDLHQLQNLYFALTGKELEIDEEKLKAAL